MRSSEVELGVGGDLGLGVSAIFGIEIWYRRQPRIKRAVRLDDLRKLELLLVLPVRKENK
jgi:hypothetical protein